MHLSVPGTQQPTLHEWSTFRMELLWIYRGRVKPYDRHRTVSHAYGNWLWYLEEGEVEVRSSGNRLRAKKGQWILCPAAESEQHFSGAAKILSIRFLCQWPTGENLFYNKEGVVCDAEDFPQLLKKANALHQLVERNFPSSRELLFKQSSSIESFLKLQTRYPAFLLELVKVLVASGHELSYARSMDNRAALAIRCLNKASLDEPFPSDQLLQVTDLSKVHLNRILLEQIGMSAREFWEKRREDAACYFLEVTDESIKSIGYNLGFRQASHFTNWFKRRKGQSPVVYRQ
ncbi:helix-turn-helix domain-containing protein [Kiritimatiellaeota bacterium B1221]|nr:helix-turn-helix domain-containing protein [Kiritimatiellaeota bacterium B1221]